MPGGRPFAKGYDSRRNGVTPGPGVPSAIVRALARKSFHDRIPILCDIADGKPLPFVRWTKVTNTTGEPASPGEEPVFSQGSYQVYEGAVSADISERIKALELLGRMGAVAIPGIDEFASDSETQKRVLVVKRFN
jgi:hypothetical protein